MKIFPWNKDFETMPIGSRDKMKRLEEQVIQIKAAKAVAARYNQLLLAVKTKYPDKSRHDTALMYIKQVEAFSEDDGDRELQPTTSTHIGE